MISMDKKYTTRDGLEVKLFATDLWGLRPVIGAVLIGSNWVLQSWCIDGAVDSSDYSARDLIEAQETIEIDVWVNVYDKNIVSQPYDTKSDADDGVSDYLKRIACINIKRTVAVGEGLC